jgi:cytidine deaminase
MTDEMLVKEAEKAKSGAYAPYSGFRVGAALLSGSGKVYTGANIENISYGATNCAERTAVFKAVFEGERVIDAIAVASDSEDFIYPCGICRQVLAEFGRKDTRILCSNSAGEFRAHTLEELLPNAFVSFK